MSYPCSECGRHSFPQPGWCYWCSNPLSDTERAAKVAEGIATPRAAAGPEDKWEAERQRLNKRHKSLRK